MLRLLSCQCCKHRLADAANDEPTRWGQRLVWTMNRVCGAHEPPIITRNGQPSVVMLSLDDAKALEETAYLLRSPANTRRLLDAIDSLEQGQGQERCLPDDRPE